MNNDLTISQEITTMPLAGETEVRQRRTRDSRLGVTDYRMGGRSQIGRPAHFLEIVIQNSLMPKKTSLPKARYSLSRKCVCPIHAEPVQFQGKHGQIVLDQLRTVDKVRLVKKLGRIGSKVQQTVIAVLGEMFAD
jgi:mRNA-degrading endonuclease toxin of MazEF toxin-antitoxin module